MMAPPRALSVRQPWAWAIVHAGKDVENRPRGTRFRGSFFVHASSFASPDEDAAARAWMGQRGLVLPPPLAELPRGGIIGRAEIVGVVEPHASCGRVWHMCDRYGLVLEGAEPLPFRPLRGMLSFFPVAMQEDFTREQNSDGGNGR